MSRWLLFVATVLLVAVRAGAQIDPRPDGVGFYFDQGAQTNCITTTAAYQPVTAYLLLTRMSEASGLSGWEAAVTIEGDLIDVSWQLGLDGTNFLEPPLFAVGIGHNPAPAQPVMRLVTCSGLVLSPGSAVRFFIDGVPTPSLPEFPHNPVYAAGDDSFDLRPLWQSTGGYDIPVAAINLDCPVSTAHSTWGGVKALYE